MFEAYAIGVTLKLNNLISPQLLLIGPRESWSNSFRRGC